MKSDVIPGPLFGLSAAVVATGVSGAAIGELARNLGMTAEPSALAADDSYTAALRQRNPHAAKMRAAAGPRQSADAFRAALREFFPRRGVDPMTEALTEALREYAPPDGYKIALAKRAMQEGR